MSEEIVGELTIRSSEAEPPVVVSANQPPQAARGDLPFDRPDVLIGPVTIRLSGDGREIMVGGSPASATTTRIHLDGQDGDITIRDSNGNDVFRFDSRFAVLDIGGLGNEGDIRLRNNADTTTIHLDGNAGDIILTNADCAEDFDVVDEAIEPGTVLTIGDGGQLRPSSQPYDRSVVGVMSGGGGFQPGMILDRRAYSTRRRPIALAGKVYCRIDAGPGSVRVGDLLTTSATVGHAMRVSDTARAFGAVIGKALAPLAEGRDLVPILVALQ